MHNKTKTVEISNRRYQIRKLPADVGSFILIQMMSAASKAVRSMGEENDSHEKPKDIEPVSGKERVRGLVTLAFMGSNFDGFKFVQSNCLMLISREEAPNSFIPIYTDSGRWAGEAIEDEIGGNLGLVMKLTMEVLTFNLADFFEQGGMESGLTKS